MFKKDIINRKALSQLSATFTDPQLKEAKRRMVGEFFNRLKADDDSLYWTGTQRDLMELVHIVWRSDIVRGGYGEIPTLKELTKKLFDSVHMPVPSNPYQVAYKAAQRKGVRGTTMLNRYCWRYYIAKRKYPLGDEIVQIDENNCRNEANEHE